jgi:hypothetical protein
LKVLVLVCLVLSAATASAYTLAQYNYWHFTLYQPARNNAILAAANGQPRGVTSSSLYGNCYKWASKMVSTASTGVMQLPLILPSNYYWNSDVWIQSRTYTTKVGTIPAVKNALPGQIVQMETLFADGTWGPHTAIVHHIDSSGVWFIDANYTRNQVTLHKMTWDYFNSHVSKYSINVIG